MAFCIFECWLGLASWGYMWETLGDTRKEMGVLREKTAFYLSIIHSTAILLGHLALTTGIVPGVLKVRTKKALFCVKVA